MKNVPTAPCVKAGWKTGRSQIRKETKTWLFCLYAGTSNVVLTETKITNDETYEEKSSIQHDGLAGRIKSP
jgi:hypothetical protein